MVDKKVDYKKVEVVNTYYEGIIEDYRVLCDRCKGEIPEGFPQFDIERYDDNDEYGDSVTLCFGCLRKEFDEWMKEPKGEFDISCYTVDNKSQIGKKSTMAEPVYELFKKSREKKND